MVWLGFLAHHAVTTSKSHVGVSNQSIAWWTIAEEVRIARAVNWTAGFIGGLTAGGAIGLFTKLLLQEQVSFMISIALSTVLGLAGGGWLAQECAHQSPPPTSKKIGRPRDWRLSLTLSVSIIAVAALSWLLMANILMSLLLALAICPVAAAYMFAVPDIYLMKVATARAVYEADVSQTGLFFSAYTLSVGAAAFILFGPLAACSAGLLGGLAGSLTYGFLYKISFDENISGLVAWVRFRIAHAMLASMGKLPWRFFEFLEDASDRYVLKQNGATYEFLHIAIRDELVRSGARRAQSADSSL